MHVLVTRDLYARELPADFHARRFHCRFRRERLRVSFGCCNARTPPRPTTTMTGNPPGPGGLRRSAAVPTIRQRPPDDEMTKWDLLRDSLLLGDDLEFLRGVLDRYEFTAAFQDASRADLRRLTMRLGDRRLFLGVVGEFSSGKSTLINAILREPFLQADVLQGTTSVPTLVGYGHHLDAQVLFRDGESTWFTRKCLPQRRRWPWLFSSLEDVSQPDREHLREFVRQHTAAPEAGNKIAAVCLTHPAQRFSREGLVVLDTPGTGSSDYPEHEETTQQAVRHLCDAVIVVIPADVPVSQSLLAFLQNHLQDLLPRCIFMVTRMDLVRKKEERPRVLSSIQARLQNALDRPPVVVAAAPGVFLQRCSRPEANGREQSGGPADEERETLAREYLATEAKLMDFLRAGKLLALAGGIAGRTAELMTMLEKELQGKDQEYGGQRQALEEHPILDLTAMADRWKLDLRTRIGNETENLREGASSSLRGARQALTATADRTISQTQDRTGLKAVVETALPQALRHEESGLQQSAQNVYGEMVGVAQRLHGEFVAEFQQAYASLATLGALSVPGSSFVKSREHAEPFAKSVSGRVESAVRAFSLEATFTEWGLVVGIAIAGLIVGIIGGPVGMFFGAAIGGGVGRLFWKKWGRAQGGCPIEDSGDHSERV